MNNTFQMALPIIVPRSGGINRYPSIESSEAEKKTSLIEIHPNPWGGLQGEKGIYDHTSPSARRGKTLRP